MKPPLLIGLLLLFGAVGMGWYLQAGPSQKVAPAVTQTVETAPRPQSTSAPSPVDARAAFAIFTNGTFRVFTAAMYHNRSKDVYIDATNPNIIKIKRSGITWNDFFKTLPFSLNHDCLITGTKETFCTNTTQTLRFYLNGVRETTVLDEVIYDGDKLLVSYGNEGEDAIGLQLKKIPDPTR